MDAEKVESILTDATLVEEIDLKQALEKVALLDAQLKDMNPNLDSISEYACVFDSVMSINTKAYTFKVSEIIYVAFICC